MSYKLWKDQRDTFELLDLLVSHVFDGWEHIPEALQLMKDKPADLIKPVVRLV